jgi:hypothetical protein
MGHAELVAVRILHHDAVAERIILLTQPGPARGRQASHVFRDQSTAPRLVSGIRADLNIQVHTVLGDLARGH